MPFLRIVPVLRLFSAAALSCVHLLACGDSTSTSSQSTSSNGPTTSSSSAAGGSGSGGGEQGAGGSSAGGNGAGGNGVGGAGGAGMGTCDASSGPNSCDDQACFAHQACIEEDLSQHEMAGYALCGETIAFDAADSDEACDNYSFDNPFPQLTAMCQFATYNGTIAFYCPPAPASDTVGIRWVAHGSTPVGQTGVWDTINAEYWYNSGGGSSTSLNHYDFELAGATLESDFVGYQKLTIAQTKTMFRQWFGVLNFGDPGPDNVAGGFKVAIDPDVLF